MDRTGGLTARQVRASLYRRDNGESTLILWYDPVLSGQRSVRVALNFEAAADTPIVHDIGSSYTKQLLDDVIDVSEHPTVITYRASNADASVHVGVKSACYRHHAHACHGGWHNRLGNGVRGCAKGMSGRRESWRELARDGR